MWCTANGLNPSTAGLHIESKSPRIIKRNTLSAYTFSNDQALSAWNKLEGGKFSPWTIGANRHAIKHVWQGHEYSKIFAEHFDFYEEDPGLDGTYLLLPSKWEEYLDGGYLKTIENWKLGRPS